MCDRRSELTNQAELPDDQPGICTRRLLESPPYDTLFFNYFHLNPELLLVHMRLPLLYKKHNVKPWQSADLES